MNILETVKNLPTPAKVGIGVGAVALVWFIARGHSAASTSGATTISPDTGYPVDTTGGGSGGGTSSSGGDTWGSGQSTGVSPGAGGGSLSGGGSTNPGQTVGPGSGSTPQTVTTPSGTQSGSTGNISNGSQPSPGPVSNNHVTPNPVPPSNPAPVIHAADTNGNVFASHSYAASVNAAEGVYQDHTFVSGGYTQAAPTLFSPGTVTTSPTGVKTLTPSQYIKPANGGTALLNPASPDAYNPGTAPKTVQRTYTLQSPAAVTKAVAPTTSSSHHTSAPVSSHPSTISSHPAFIGTIPFAEVGML